MFSFLSVCIHSLTKFKKPTTTQPAPTGPQLEMRRGVPIWHGLRLAQKILGDEMPKVELAQRVIKDWGVGLAELAENLEKQEKMKSGSYGDQALTVWRECSQD